MCWGHRVNPIRKSHRAAQYVAVNRGQNMAGLERRTAGVAGGSVLSGNALPYFQGNRLAGKSAAGLR